MLNISRYLTHPAMKKWFLYSDFQNSNYLAEFLEHALTYTFLYKFGGTVISFDILLRK